MPKRHTEIFVRAALVAETLRAHSKIARRLVAGGLSQARLDEGLGEVAAALGEVEALMAHEAGDDHTAHSQVQRSIEEIDGWFAATLLRLERLLGERIPDDWSSITGRDLSCEMVELLALMRVRRVVASMCTRPRLWSYLEGRRPRLSDDLQRGLVLMRKTTQVVDKLYNIRHPTVEERAQVKAVIDTRGSIEAWLAEVEVAAHTGLEGHAWALGLLGLVPEAGEGEVVQFGGTAYDVLRHGRRQVKVYDATPAPACPGWGAGAGGNRENYWEREDA